MENPNTWKELEKIIYNATMEHTLALEQDIIGGSLEKHIAAKIRESDLFYLIKDIATNYDHDEDAHKYNTRCRQCEAQKILDIF